MLTEHAAPGAAALAFSRQRGAAVWRGVAFLLAVLAAPVVAAAAEPGFASPADDDGLAVAGSGGVESWLVERERRRYLLRMSAAGGVDATVAAAVARRAAAHAAAAAAEMAARQSQARSRTILTARGALSANAARLARTQPADQAAARRLASMLAVMAPSARRWRQQALSAAAAAAAMEDESARAARQAEHDAAAHRFDLAMALAETRLELALAEAAFERQPAPAALASWPRPEKADAAGFAAVDAAMATVRPAAGREPPDATRSALPADGLALLAPDPDPLAIRLPGDAEEGGVPIVGPVSTRFAGGGVGLLDRGVTFASELAQPVRAPRTGIVAFAGPFKSFGLLLIVEHGHEYHSLLAGMARLDVHVGDVVVAGQTIGSIAGSETMPARLYLELRHNGRPVNPLPWLAAREDKVRG